MRIWVSTSTIVWLNVKYIIIISKYINEQLQVYALICSRLRFPDYPVETNISYIKLNTIQHKK